MFVNLFTKPKIRRWEYPYIFKSLASDRSTVFGTITVRENTKSLVPDYQTMESKCGPQRISVSRSDHPRAAKFTPRLLLSNSILRRHTIRGGRSQQPPRRRQRQRGVVYLGRIDVKEKSRLRGRRRLATLSLPAPSAG